MLRLFRELLRQASAPVALAVLLGGAFSSPLAASPSLVFQWSPSAADASRTPTLDVHDDLSGAASPALVASAAGGDWNAFYVTAPGLLQGGRLYTAVVDYTVVTPTRPGSTFYLFARSEKLGDFADSWTRWTGAAGQSGSAVLHMALRDMDDWRITVGMHGPGAIRMTGFRLYQGDWMTFQPGKQAASAAHASGAGALPLPPGCGVIAIAPPHPPRALEVDASTFGLLAENAGAGATDASAERNASALQTAIDAARQAGASTLRIEPGTYRIGASASIAFDRLSDLTVDGHGAVFVFTRLLSGAPAIRVSGCRRVDIRNLNLDWDWSVRPLATVFHVDSASADHTSYVLTFPDDTASEVAALPSAPWQYIAPIVLLRPTGGPAGSVLGTGKPAAFEPQGEHSARVAFTRPVALAAGETYWIRHCDYEMPAIEVVDGKDLAFDGVTVYSMPGMGWIMHGDLDHWALRNCRIELPPGSRRPLTTAADGVHISSSHGYFLMDNCRIGNCGDDCVNIHDNCAQGVVKIDDHTLRVRSVGWRLALDPGNTIELFRGDYAPMGYVSKIAASRRDGDDAIVAFSDPLPDNLPDDTIVWNRSYETNNVHITRCWFHDNIVRGILMAARAVTVDHCVIERTAYDGFQFHTELDPPHWWEGHGAQNVVLTQNRIVDVNRVGHNGGPAIFGIPQLPGGPTSVALFSDILIADNEIVNALGPAIELASFRNVTIRGNRFENTTSPYAASPVSSSIRVERGAGLRAQSNVWLGGFCALPGLSFDPSTTTSIALSARIVRPAPAGEAPRAPRLSSRTTAQTVAANR